MESDKFRHQYLKTENILKKLQILLSDPCSENWDEMQQSNEGRYCEICTKHIVDLTAKTDAELIEFFSKKKANICGRLLPSQLNRQIASLPKPAGWKWMVPFALGMSFVAPLKAQLKPIVVEQDKNLSKSFSDFTINSVNAPVIDTIKGRVIDAETKKPLAGVKIKKDGFANVIATTDKEGKFACEVGNKYPIDALKFEHFGYKLIVKKIDGYLLVEMQQNTPMMLGMVTTVTMPDKPMYLISSGKQTCTVTEEYFKKINPEWIAKTEVINDLGIAAIYGARAAKGVVKVEIKKKYAHKLDFSKKK